MTEEAKSSIPKLALDGANWVLYKERMTVVFGMRLLSDHLMSDSPTAKYATASSKGGLTGQERWDAEEFMFRDLIGMLVPDSVYLHVKKAVHAKDMWD